MEWWEYKLPPLLAIGYAAALKSGTSFIDLVPHILFLLLSVTIGAIYVSIINDLTDIEIDLASGKKNRMANVSTLWRWLLPVTCLLIGAIFMYYFYPDRLSLLLYLMPWMCFSLYSFEPVRLKDKGIWGVFADASGSHIFTSLLMISSVSFYAGAAIDWFFFCSTAIWAFCYGLRGILWHQFYDRDNDITAGVNSYAVNVSPQQFKSKEVFLFLLELTAISVMLLRIQLILPFVFLLLYGALSLIKIYSLKDIPVIIISPDKHFFILMGDFYQVFLPIALLITAAAKDPYVVLVLIVHVALFPKNTSNALRQFRDFLLTKL